MKKFISLFFLLLAVITLIACGRKNEKGKVYFLNFKPEVANVYNNIVTDFRNETGIEVRVVTAASGQYEQTLSSEIIKSAPPTIFQINGPIGFQNWKEYCYDLKDTKLYDLVLDKGLAVTEGGGVYGIPYAIEGYGLVYNKDVLTEYFNQSNRALTDITNINQVNSFTKFKTLVEDLDTFIKGTKLTTNAPAIDRLVGVFASTSLAAGSQWPFQTHLANIPFYYEFIEKNPNNAILGGLAIKTGELQFKYNQEYKNIFDLYINYGVTPRGELGQINNNMATAEFAQGKGAFYQQGNWIYNDIKKVTEGNVITAENIGMMPIYTGHPGEENYTIPVGTENYFCINKEASEADIKASIQFLEWLFTSQTGKRYVVQELGFNAPFSSFSETERPSDPLAKEVLRLMNIQGKKVILWSFAAFPSEDFKNQFGSALLEYAQGKKEWSEVVQIVITAWVTK